MADQWFIARGDQQLGPYTVFELKELGMSGNVQPTDSVWKEGMHNRVPATRVKGLLPAELVATTPTDPAPPPGSAGSSAAGVASESTNAPAAATSEEEEAARKRAAQDQARFEVKKRRVTGSRGAIIQSQDGKDVRFRKKCVKCGTEDRVKSTMLLRPGTTRTTFYCPNCRKLQPVEISAV